jgi:hypothetical protein
MIRSIAAIVGVGFLVVIITGCGDAGAGSSEGPDITSGLVAYYPFTGNANDASGNGNNPADPADVVATLTTDRFGHVDSAYEFDGRGSQILIPSTPSSSLETPTTAGTMAAWIRLDGYSLVGDGFGPILMKTTTTGGSASTNPFMYRMLAGTGGIGIALNTWDHSAGGSYSFDTTGTRWYHVASTWDGATARFYVDGGLVDETAFAQTASSDGLPLVIGADTPGLYESFNGTLDEIRIYNRALSAAEIQFLSEAD